MNAQMVEIFHKINMSLQRLAPIMSRIEEALQVWESDTTVTEAVEANGVILAANGVLLAAIKVQTDKLEFV